MEALATPVQEVSPDDPLINEEVSSVVEKTVSGVEVEMTSTIAPVEENGGSGHSGNLLPSK